VTGARQRTFFSSSRSTRRKEVLKRFIGLLHGLTKHVVDESLVIAAARGMSLRPETAQNVVVQPNRDARLAGSCRNDETAPSPES